MNGPIFGMYRGVVTNAKDPRNKKRLKARIPEVLGESESDWALPCIQPTGQPTDQFVMPDIGTHVWIEFEAGDLSRPVWMGIAPNFDEE